MNSTTESAPTSRRLSTVQQLLEELGSMKAEGLGARERLEFLQRHVPELIGEEFSYDDAFDVEARASSARREELGNLSGSINDLGNAWRAAPLSQQVKDAGAKLVGHLRGFVDDAERQERHAETEMLGQVWESSPDIRELYPWLNAWTGPVAKLGVHPAAQEPHVQQEPEPDLKATKAELEKEAALEDVEGLSSGEREMRELEKLWPDARKLERRFEGLNEKLAAKTDVKEPDFEKPLGGAIKKGRFKPWPKEPSGTRPSSEQLEDGQVVGHVSSEPDPDELKRMRQEAWTQALRDVTLERWNFHLEAEGHVGGRGHGTAMLWELEEDRNSHARLEVTEGDQPGDRHVRLAASSRELGDRELEREMSEADLAELHIDPSSFVKDVLGPK